jgi:hypothetical protein
MPRDFDAARVKAPIQTWIDIDPWTSKGSHRAGVGRSGFMFQGSRAGTQTIYILFQRWNKPDPYTHTTSQTFTVSNLPDEFTSGLIRSCITCVNRTDKTLLNEPTLHGRNIRHILFEPRYYAHVDEGVLYNATCATNVVVYLHVSWIIYMYFVRLYGLDLCTMYNSYGVYLCVLWTICRYKFSRCYVIIFQGIFVPFIDFW